MKFSDDGSSGNLAGNLAKAQPGMAGMDKKRESMSREFRSRGSARPMSGKPELMASSKHSGSNRIDISRDSKRIKRQNSMDNGSGVKNSGSEADSFMSGSGGN